MSDHFYEQLWLETKRKIEDVIKLDLELQGNFEAGEKFEEIIQVYFRYRKIVSSLVQCFFQTLSRQKVQVIEKFLGCSIARMLEYKTHLIKLEHEWPGDLLVRMKLTPADIEIPIPPKRFQIRNISKEEFAKAVMMVQKHERARASRRKLSYQIQRRSTGFEDTEKFCNAVVTVQRFWRGFYTRKLLRLQQERLDQVLGLVPGVRDSKILKKDQENFNRRLDLQSEAARETSELEKARVFDKIGPRLMEDITDELREWFKVWYQDSGHFGIFPSAAEGGSVLIATGQVLDEKPGPGLARPKSQALEILVQLSQQHSAALELDNDDVCYEIQLEARRRVDEAMRKELKRLNQALAKDFKANKIKFKVPKGKKRKRKKKELDADKIKKMFDELVEGGIIRTYPASNWDKWVGDASSSFDPVRIIRLGDVKREIIDDCVLPLLTQEGHKLAPLIKSVCICGLPGSGKSLLANLISSSTAAILMDLTPGNLTGILGKEQKRLVKMLIAVGRSREAAVVLIDGGDKPWWKKLPPGEKKTCRGVRKMLMKIKKAIRPGDRLLILGLASSPWKTSKAFYKFYSRLILIPPEDPSSLFLFYQQTLPYLTHPLNSYLSRLCYPLGAIEKALKSQHPLSAPTIASELTYWNPTHPRAIKQFEKFESKAKKKE